MTSRHESPPSEGGGDQPNTEWQLCQLIDSLAAEVDCVEDTLSLKSYARGVAFAVKKLGLDLAVQARVDPDGRVLFRTADSAGPCSTVLHLELSQVIESQLEESRKALEEGADLRPVSVLPGIEPHEVRALGNLGIFTLDDLERYTRTSAAVTEVSRRTGISEPRLRHWLGLPFLAGLEPPVGAPGELAVLLGGNLGSPPEPAAPAVCFGDSAAEILGWSDERITVRVPAHARTGPVVVVVDGRFSNALTWQEAAVRLVLDDLTWSPVSPKEGETVVFGVRLGNRGERESGAFALRGEVDGIPIAAWLEASLGPGEERRRQVRATFAAGEHRFCFVADPEGLLAVGDRATTRACATLEVPRVPQPLLILSKRLLGSARVEGGTAVVFEVEAANAGDAPIARAPLEDAFDPRHLRLRSAEPPPDVPSTEAGKLGWRDLGGVAPGQSRTVRVTFQALPQLGPVETTNTASVIASQDQAGGTLPAVRAAVNVTILPRLAELPDLGPARRRRLKEAGIRSVAALASAAPERIAALVNVDAQTAAALIYEAREALNPAAEAAPPTGRRRA